MNINRLHRVDSTEQTPKCTRLKRRVRSLQKWGYRRDRATLLNLYGRVPGISSRGFALKNVS